MQQDLFIEKIVKRKWGRPEIAMSVSLTLAAVFLILFLLSLSVTMSSQILFYVVTIAAFALGYLAFRIITGLRYEYEYSVTNDDLTIDKIIARRKRKRIFNGSCKQFTQFAPVSDPDFKTAVKPNQKRLDCRSGDHPDQEWFVITRKDNEEIIILFEPDDRFITAFKKFNPRVIKNKF